VRSLRSGINPKQARKKRDAVRVAAVNQIF
jgi:hypothetical protein